jgi:HAD superfamily hydrolase (TIGR01484 family)
MTESAVEHRLPDHVRLVVADVDGTLVTPDKIASPRARAAVRQIMEAGIAFTITSGRPPRRMKALIDELRVQGPIGAITLRGACWTGVCLT